MIKTRSQLKITNIGTISPHIQFLNDHESNISTIFAVFSKR